MLHFWSFVLKYSSKTIKDKNQINQMKFNQASLYSVSERRDYEARLMRQVAKDATRGDNRLFLIANWLLPSLILYTYRPYASGTMSIMAII